MTIRLMMQCVATVLIVLCSFVIFSHGKRNQCPGGKASCPDDSTCCVLNNGGFGCCPIQDAVCCGDSVHCCPDGYTCDVKNGICKMGEKSVPLLKKIPATSAMNEIGSVDIVKCNQKFACPDRYTCCQVDSSYKCCPMAQAVCCSDHTHCCPRGYKCSSDGKTCTAGAHTLLALSTTTSKTMKRNGLLDLITGKIAKGKKSPLADLRKMLVYMTGELLEGVVCPDGGTCPDGSTCCKLSSGEWGCCPLPKAVCCSDGVHCCPNGYKCDVSEGTCIRGSQSIAMVKKIPALKRKVEVSSVVCPDGASQCPDGNTCCKLASGQWGCCPLPKAVCCSDGIHCCPNGYTCVGGQCSGGSQSIAMVKKIPALKRKVEVSSVVCPDGASQCPDGNTCCKLASGQWGCCPLPKAVCCSDGIHCCPNGYTCVGGQCSGGSQSIAMVKKIPALKRKAEVSSVVCPDGASQCPDGNTCCKLVSGQWGCCPLPKAVCCSDGEHCCPSGYNCDVSAGTCNKGSDIVALLQKVPASKKEPEVSNVICPDGQSQCPDGTTCCKLTSGQYGCCPLPDAVCCSDGVHCCPNGYTCDVSEGTCTKGGDIVALLEKIPASKKKPELRSVVCPDGQSECPDGNTCCKLASGQYGCCPLPEAVCCEDRVHCCPNGYTCDVSAGTCSKGSDIVALLEKIPASKKEPELKTIVCPDGQSQCPDGNTCCKLASGQYGCCPLPDAVCCSDGQHCCPKGYRCDLSAGTCTKGSKITVLFEKVPASKKKAEVGNVICPDGQSECPDGNTCCKLSSGQYGCCPLPKAVCCSDGLHCCPEDYTCDVSAGTCTQGSQMTALFEKVPATKKKPELKSVVCPDGQSECPDGTTCCKLSSGGYGCCPLPDAVCCSDGVHCCPNGYTCGAETCSKGSDIVALLEKIPALQKEPELKSVVCPDGESQCQDGNTCCKLSSGQWGCCPLPNAVCCSDGVHCCPNGYTCDVSEGTCTKGSDIVALLEKIPASKKKPELRSIVCPDGQSECPDGSTCCKLSSGGYGCCPLPDAVCCSDGVHCCPNGYTCDVSTGTCSKGSVTVAVLEKIPASKKKPELRSVVCPDGESECPDGNTCCKLSSGQWGCCPLPEAVCCSDGVHCCPHGTTCDLSSGKCNVGSQSVAMVKKTPALKRHAEVSSVVCPDGASQCPDGSTCCKLSSGQWGCCPLPDAVCCSDGLHCCPSGYTCDVSAGKCNKGSDIVALLQKIPASKKEPEVSNVICPDGQSECPDGNTCCKLSSGGYGCCPLPDAVCCSDGVHCCPNGYTCGAETCSKGSDIVALLEKIPALQKEPELKSVVCPDGESQCPDGNTCCKLVSGQWGCCPLPDAVCCSDGVHCCPSGYTCDVSEGTCTKGSDIVALLEKIPASKKKPELRSIVCPDGQSQCPDGSTCCKLSSGGYGCCPLPDAVCCSDGVHCCPNGYTCDVSTGTCSKGSVTVAVLEKIPASKKKPELRSVVCPDGESECPDGNTCCKLSSGQWGCCPLPEAVCCSDGVHCCPHGTTCDLSSGKCNVGSQSVAMVKKTPALKRHAEVSSVVCPDGASQCPDGSTCCKLSSGQWGCCPLPDAVCCSDGLHCCPSGYTCDVSAGKCNKGSDIVALLQKIPASKKEPEVSNVICPDGQSECPDGNTCCKLSSGGYGCCPLPDAVCCSDGVHCCPNGYTCGAETCSKGSDIVALLEKIPALQKEPELKSVVCPDGESQCPDGNTCCKLVSGQWGCCPLPDAVCCSDGVHCCPSGYTCDVSEGTCTKGSDIVALLEKIPASKKKPELRSIVCPDGQSECPDGSTCCKLSSGGYGCCPLPDAVCCSDGVHCCPNGYTCDVSTGTCSKGSVTVAVLEKIPASKKKPELRSVVCPDGESECPDGNTCCKLSSGQWGCCPLPEAVCCSDGVHCCPHGTTCDLSSGKCNVGSQSVAMVKKTPALKRHAEVSSVVCPDGASQCPDGSTCCKLSSGQWGCCPLPDAVCCSDGLHCCPSGYTCDVSAGKCNKGSDIVALLQKIPASKKEPEVSNVICPDGQSECPDGNTCCKLTSGQWGCCPLPEAICCSDGEHCCPHGTTCDLSSGSCNRGSQSIAMVKKIPALKRKEEVSSVVCPDGASQCPDGNTCCKLSSGQYGCCPLPDAVCCSDGVHCCPSGYTCDVSEGTCSKGSDIVALLEKIPASKKKPELKAIVCPDGESQCPDGNTCCKLTSGQYGCCPLPNAVCCSDGQHCCPQGYTCDVSAGTCTQGNKLTALFVKVPASKKKEEVGSVVCPDGQSQCPDGNTCCKLASGQYGCCPLPNAVCCNDGEHCCPSGYTCDVSAGTCTKGSDIVALLEKIPASKKEPELRSIVCPDGESQCPDGNTCCKLTSGQYGCCPLPNAVCCSDGQHCCPQGYTCDVSAGTCTQGNKLTALFVKVPASKKKEEVGSVVCPDGQSQCPDGNTCCKLASGQYGCCPLPNAVCCNDGEHCCPSGYTCDVSAGTCTKGSDIVALLEKIPASKKEPELRSVVCPDGQSECPDGNTCCKLSSGQYGCCPLPNAVCCSDGVHCCPNGYTCDVSEGSCSKGSDIVALLQKVPASKKEPEVSNVICPDGQSQCPDGTTCCKLTSGQYGCCPLPDAVCCSDGVHCCPNGYTCDVSTGTCSQGSRSIPMVTKMPASTKRIEVSNVICPDGESQCPDDSTCCKLSSGQWGCCPLPKAVCCSDGVHCCPNGYTCDVSSGTCQQGSQSISMFLKMPATNRPAHGSAPDDIVCPDKEYQCPKGSTCCKLPSGSYGCCPLDNAVCCDDHKHCCPQGYVCDVKGGKCNKTAERIGMIDNIPAIKQSTNAEIKYIYCPDGCSCLDYETCCELADGHYGCCPCPNAVCCSDHEHCCPAGYRCDLSAGMCVTGNVRLPMLRKVKAPRRQKAPDVNLDEKIHFVPGGAQGGDPVANDDILWPEK